MSSRAALLVLLPFFLGTPSAAQSLQAYWGPTLGISTPNFGSPEVTYHQLSNPGFTGNGSPIPSPIIGANAGFTLRKHLTLDAALQYSYTGQFYSLQFRPPHADYIHEERLRIHKATLPLTVGYAGNIGRTCIRVGLGCALNYLVAGRVTIDFTAAGPNGAPIPTRATADLFDEMEALYSGSRFQALPRASLSIIPGHRWMISAAYNHGKSRSVILPSLRSGLYSSLPRNSAIDLSATYLIRRSEANTQAKERASDE